MLQFLSFNKKTGQVADFPVIGGYELFKFFAKRFLYILFFLYSTIFVAAIDPFVNSPYEIWVFYIGALITLYVLLRFCSHLIKIIKFKSGKISLGQGKIVISSKDKDIEIPVDNLKNIQVSIFGNIIFREQDRSVSFPLILMSDNNVKEFLSYFNDIAEKRTVLLKKIYDFFEALLVAFILAMHIREYIIQAYYIPTGSMEDTLLVGDHLLVEKITYGPIIPRMIGMDKEIHLNCIGLRKVKRYDIVIFRPPNEEKKDYIKRCIALPGERVNLKNGYVYINGEKLNEPYTKGYTTYDGFAEKKIEGIVPEGKVVVLGDNRENSSDSRYFGYLDIERIKGRAFILYWNTEQVKNFDFSRWGLIR